MSDLIIRHNGKLIIRCATCMYFYECSGKTHCTHFSCTKEDEMSTVCLERIPLTERDNAKHYKYPHLSKFYSVHKYLFWEPKADLLEDGMEIYNFLEKKDFEL